MIFNFSTFNHCDTGQRCLEDLTIILSAQLRALGHTTTTNEEFSHSGINVLYESFADEGTIPRIAAAHARGCRFLYIATEEPQEGCFNGRLDNAMDARMAAFPEAARYAEGILHLVPGARVTEWYSRYAPAAYAELGHAGELCYGGPEVEPEFAFGFYGQVTPRRATIFERLAEISGGPILTLPFITHAAAERDAAMRKARVILQVRAHDSMPIVSSSRCATALNLGRPVVAEPHGQAEPWDSIIGFSNTLDDFYAEAIKIAANWHSVHGAQMQRYACILTPKVCLGEPLRRIGIT